MSQPANPYRPFKVAASIGIVVLLCLAAFVSLRDREPGFEPDQRYLFQGKIAGLGPVAALLSLDGESPALQLLTGDGQGWWEIYGERHGGELSFAQVDYQEDVARTNRTFHCTLLDSPLALLGTMTDLRTGRAHDFDLQPAAVYEVLRTRTGFRLGQRGWRISFHGAVPRFLTPSDWEAEVIAGLREEVADKGKTFTEELKPAWSERWRYVWEPSATSDWTLDTVWHVEYRSSQLLSFRADHYSYTGGTHGNLETECQTYWRRDLDVQRVQLADFFRSDSDWERRLSDFIVAELKRRRAAWVDDGEIKALDKDMLSIFTVSRPGLAFYFDPYAVGSYAEGRYRVFVPFKELEPVLDTNGVLSALRSPGAK